MLSLVLPLGGLCVGLLLPEPWRLPFAVFSTAAMVPLFLLLRVRWRTRQQIRIFGNVVEHRDGAEVTRVVVDGVDRLRGGEKVKFDDAPAAASVA